MLSVDEARAAIAARISSRLPSERVALDDALWRVLAADFSAGRDLPPHDNSAMDGYAVVAAELPGVLPIAGEVAAGADPSRSHASGTATRIMTGAPLPAGADTVVMREEVEVDGNRATFAAAAALGANIRRRGEDIARGATAVRGGTIIGPGEIGLLAALAAPTLEVTRKARVSILSTGDELVPLTDNPPADRIINSNAHALAAQVRECGGIAICQPIALDTKSEVTRAIGAALEGADVLVTSGGVSVGDYDFVKEALIANGIEPDFWKIAMKPGKPVVFGVAPGGALVFGLPGNPVSSMVSFELFVRPALLALAGARETERPRTRVALSGSYRKDAGRSHFLRARVRWDAQPLVADVQRKQGSGMLTSMSRVDALVCVPAETTDVAAGELLEAILLVAR